MTSEQAAPDTRPEQPAPPEVTTSVPRTFVSSTIYDFRDLRSALKFWLREQGHIVLASEYADFERRPDQGTFDSCFEAIATCNYYVLLVGFNRGSWYDESKRISVTQQEFRVASELAKQGRIKLVILIRQEVFIALREHPDTPKDADASDNSPGDSSRTFQDLDFTRSFIAEIEHTVLGASGDTPPGTVWHYRFRDFDDIVDALRINLQLTRSVRRQALLANLRWELLENLSAMMTKWKGLPDTNHGWLNEVRRRIRLKYEDLQRQIDISAGLAVRVSIFWTTERLGAERLRTAALEEAIHSGDFLTYQQDRERLVGGTEYRAMQTLLARIGEYRRISTSLLQDRLDAQAAFHEGVRAKRASVPILGRDLASLYKFHDVIQDIVALSVALLRYIIEPAAPFRMPPLSPISPLDDQIPALEAERATHEDVEGWAANGVLWQLLTGDNESSAGDVDESFRQYPGLKEIFDAALEQDMTRFRLEVQRRVRTDGLDATRAWLDEIRRSGKLPELFDER